MNQAELDFCLRAKGMSINAAGHVVTPTVATSPTDTDLTYHFHGERTRTKFLFSMKMYADEVREWIEQDERQRTELMQQQLDGTSPVHRPSRRTYSCSY